LHINNDAGGGSYLTAGLTALLFVRQAPLEALSRSTFGAERDWAGLGLLGLPGRASPRSPLKINSCFVDLGRRASQRYAGRLCSAIIEAAKAVKASLRCQAKKFELSSQFQED
jgi:hypothetical protein